MATLSNLAASAQIGNSCPSCNRRTMIVEAALAVNTSIKGKVKGKQELEVGVTLNREKSKVGVRCLDCGWSRDGKL